MSVNKYLRHLFLLPEDDANRQVANGFLLGFASRQLQVLRPAGGWLRVRDTFLAEHVNSMRLHPERCIALIVDFDNYPDRLNEIRADIPSDLVGRVFVIGSLTDPEDLKRTLVSSYENIGRAMARDCLQGSRQTWGNDLLSHNEAELARLRIAVCDALIPV